jgi:hypothetical protein
VVAQSSGRSFWSRVASARAVSRGMAIRSAYSRCRQPASAGSASMNGMSDPKLPFPAVESSAPESSGSQGALGHGQPDRVDDGSSAAGSRPRSSSLCQIDSACFREHAARQPTIEAAPASHQPYTLAHRSPQSSQAQDRAQSQSVGRRIRNNSAPSGKVAMCSFVTLPPSDNEHARLVCGTGRRNICAKTSRLGRAVHCRTGSVRSASVSSVAGAAHRRAGGTISGSADSLDAVE